MGDWPAFPDSPDALARLAARFRLAVITNCDDDLFAASNRRLGVTFDWVITAQQVGTYKPSERNFEVAFERIGVPRERILHVAQSLFHDHVPAKRLGLTTAWIDRRHDRPGSGATPARVGDAGPGGAGHGDAGRPCDGVDARDLDRPDPRLCRRGRSAQNMRRSPGSRFRTRALTASDPASVTSDQDRRLHDGRRGEVEEDVGQRVEDQGVDVVDAERVGGERPPGRPGAVEPLAGRGRCRR